MADCVHGIEGVGGGGGGGALLRYWECVMPQLSCMCFGMFCVSLIAVSVCIVCLCEY